jgi:hypothetical protein
VTISNNVGAKIKRPTVIVRMDKSIIITEFEGFFSEIRWIASAMDVFLFDAVI